MTSISPLATTLLLSNSINSTFFRFHIQVSMQYFPFSVWLISLSIIPSRSTCAVANRQDFHPFYRWVTFHCAYIPSFLYPFIRWHFGYFSIWAIVDNAAMNVGVRVSFKTMKISSGDLFVLSHTHGMCDKWAQAPNVLRNSNFIILPMINLFIFTRASYWEAGWGGPNVHSLTLTTVVFNPVHSRMGRKPLKVWPPGPSSDELSPQLVSPALLLPGWSRAWNQAVWKKAGGHKSGPFFCPWSLGTLFSPYLPPTGSLSHSPSFHNPLKLKRGWDFLWFVLMYPHPPIGLQASWPRCHRQNGCVLNCKGIYVTQNFQNYTLPPPL